MKSTLSILALFSLSATSLAVPVESTSSGSDPVSVTVSYDTKYDVAASSLDAVSCSNGDYGLESQGYTTFGSLPQFHLIGGAPTVAGWDSPNCGKCYQLSYTSPSYSNSIYVTAIDAAPRGFNLAQAAMDKLTNNRSVELGRVTATYVEVTDRSLCGFPKTSS